MQLARMKQCGCWMLQTYSTILGKTLATVEQASSRQCQSTTVIVLNEDIRYCQLVVVSSNQRMLDCLRTTSFNDWLGLTKRASSYGLTSFLAVTIADFHLLALGANFTSSESFWRASGLGE